MIHGEYLYKNIIYSVNYPIITKNNLLDFFTISFWNYPARFRK